MNKEDEWMKISHLLELQKATNLSSIINLIGMISDGNEADYRPGSRCNSKNQLFFENVVDFFFKAYQNKIPLSLCILKQTCRLMLTGFGSRSLFEGLHVRFKMCFLCMKNTH